MDYLELIDAYRDEMVSSLAELIRIDSVEAEPCEDEQYGHLPFGKGVHEALLYVLNKAKADGFYTENVDNYGAHLEFGGYTHDEEGNETLACDEIMGIIGHLDVVPPGSGWANGDPFSGEVKDGKIYGRGSIDDKGPVMAAYYAMKALKDSGFEPAKRVRLILGLDEETNWKGMEYYLSKVEAPTFGFTPDADFPAIHGEKGILVFRLAKKFAKSVQKGLELRSVKGGNAANMVPDGARAVVRSDKSEDYDMIKKLAEAYREETGSRINVKGTGKSLEITAAGKSAHGSTPEAGVNAVSVLFDFLGRLKFAAEDINEYVEFYNTCIGFETDGSSMGCGLCDEPSGKLVFNVGIVEMSPEAAELTINIRYPVTYDDEAVYAAMGDVVNKYNFGIIKEKSQAPIYFPADSPFIVTLMDIYKEHTGDTESKPLVIGGGTYARATDGIVAFGCLFPGEEELAHQKDECADIDNLIKSAKIFADAIYRLTK